MNSPMPTLDEWLAEIGRLHAGGGDEGYTGPELRAHLKCGREIVRQIVLHGVTTGQIVRGQQQREGMDGRWRLVPVYRIVNKSKGGKGN